MARVPLLMLTAAASALGIVANGMSLAAPAQDMGAGATRLGSAIKQDLSVRDTAASSRARALALREEAAKAAEARIMASLAPPTGATGGRPGATAASGASSTNPADDAQFTALARIYQAMKPAKAAPVFEQLAMDVQMQVAQRMPERSAAMILANMTPAGAAALSMSLARKHPERAPAAATAKR